MNDSLLSPENHEKPEKIVLYLAGMTDNFALDCFNELFPMRIH